MKKNYEDISQQIVECIGGKDNVTFFTHCVTRLRFNVKDIDLINEEKVKKIKGVSGCIWFGEQFQIVVGSKVDDIYSKICQMYGFQEEKKLIEVTKKKWSINAVIEYISGSVAPILPILIGTSFVKIVVLLMDTFEWGVNSGTYQVLTFVGDTGFYYLPVFVGGFAAKKLNTSVPLGLLLGAILIHPSLIDAVNNSTSLNVYGIPLTLVNYSSSFFPILMSVYVMSKIENIIRRFSPESLKAILVPFLTIMIMLPILLCILGPIGTIMGTYLGNALIWIYEKLGFVGVAILGALSPLIVASGMHMTLVVYAITLFGEYGYEPLVFVTGIIVSLCQGAACLGVSIKSKDKEIKQNAFASFLTASIAGITEPALFGITLRYKKPLYAAMIGGAIGGAVAGIGAVKAYGLISSSVWNIVAFLPGGISNFVWMLIACIVGFVVSFVCTLYLYKDQQIEEKEVEA